MRRSRKFLKWLLSPERDLWAGIERAIQYKQQQAAKQTILSLPTAWAASVVTAILVTWLILSPEQENQVLVKQTSTVNSNPLDTSIKQHDKLVTLMQDGFHQQRQAMLVSFDQPKVEQLPHEMQQQLQQLALARELIINALLVNDINIDLFNLLDFTQQQGLNLLQLLYSPQLQNI